MTLKVAFLGPSGTFTEDALRAAAGGAAIDTLAAPTVHEAIMSVARGEAERALVPFENSIEGAVTATLDTLAFETDEVTIAGEYDHPIRHSLIAREELPLERIEAVLSHPQASAQCSRFIREQLPGAEVRPAASTAEAVRTVAEAEAPWAALGAAAAARLYGCAVLREGVEDAPDNVTRFVWIAPRGGEPERAGGGAWRTTLVFSELGADHPGALVDALAEFSSREVNLTRIESRPLRRPLPAAASPPDQPVASQSGLRPSAPRLSVLGRYQFFIDLEGATSDPPVREAIEALRAKAESVRVLGSYPVGKPGIP